MFASFIKRFSREPAPKFRNELSEQNHIIDHGAASIRGRLYGRPDSRGNTVSFGANSKFEGKINIRGNNNRVHIGDDCTFKGIIVVKGNRQTVSFGDHSTAADVYILCQERCDVHIGRWCMFSRKIEIRTTDAHSVVDLSSGKRLNRPESIVIGDHVWIGVGSVISKGAQVPADSIVGAMSFVNARFSRSNVILAGVPARVVREGITWNRATKPSFSEADLGYWK